MASVNVLGPEELAAVIVPAAATRPLGPEPEPGTIPAPRQYTVTLTVTTGTAQTAVDVTGEFGEVAANLARLYLGGNDLGVSATVSTWSAPVGGDGG